MSKNDINSTDALKQIIENTQKKMDGAINVLRNALGGLRTGRPSPSIFDQTRVEMYGSMMPLSQVATVTVSDSRSIIVQVWDKDHVNKISKAILESGMGFNPVVESGNTIRVPVPPLTQERRKEIIKIGQQYTEEAKIAIRNVRRDSNDAIKKLDKDIKLSEDEKRMYMDTLQEITDIMVSRAEEMLKKKTDEIETI